MWDEIRRTLGDLREQVEECGRGIRCISLLYVALFVLFVLTAAAVVLYPGNAEGAMVYGHERILTMPIDTPAEELAKWRPGDFRVTSKHGNVRRAIEEGWDWWIRSVADERAVVDHGCRFDKRAGLRVVSFFERYMRYPEDTVYTRAGEPFRLMDWQYYDVIMPVFGWMRADGTRRYRIVYIEVPKKNGKTGLFGGIAAYGVMADGEPRSRVYLGAVDREQAGLLYEAAEGLVTASPPLMSELVIIPSTKRIMHLPSGSYIATLSRESRKQEGKNAHYMLFDELHVQPDYKLWDAMRYAGRLRRQPLMVAITTSGEEKQGICWDQHLLAEQVISGAVDMPHFFGYIRGAKEDMDLNDRRVWYYANPALGHLFSEENMAEDVREAATAPRKDRVLRRYQFDQWVEGAGAWIDMKQWDACQEAFTLDDMDGCQCAFGLDLASTDDIAAMVLVFAKEGRYWLKPYFWVPERKAIEREKRGEAPYRTWAERGYITLVPEQRIDFDRIEDRILASRERYGITHGAFDRWNTAQILPHLEMAGLEMVEYHQGWKLTAYNKAFEAYVADRKIAHDGNPVLRWMVSNVRVDVSANEDIRLNRRDSSDKIDGVIATVQGVAVLDMTVEKTVTVSADQIVVV